MCCGGDIWVMGSFTLCTIFFTRDLTSQQLTYKRNIQLTSNCHLLNVVSFSQTMELARNPSMLQELMRTQDRAMSNLEVYFFLSQSCVMLSYNDYCLC